MGKRERFWGVRTRERSRERERGRQGGKDEEERGEEERKKGGVEGGRYVMSGNDEAVHFYIAGCFS